MKFKSLFIAALAILAFSACDKKKDVEPINEGTTTMSLKIEAGAFTKAIQTEATANEVVITHALVVPTLNGVASFPNSFEVDQDGVDAAMLATGDGHPIAGFPSAANGVIVYANYKNQADFKTVLKWQNIDAKNVPLKGTGPVTPHTNPTLADAKLADVTLERPVARVEVIGKIPVTKADNGVAKVNVKNVYINKYIANSDLPTAITNHQPEIGTGAWNQAAKDDYLINKLTDAVPTTGEFTQTALAAYQLFPTELFQLVVEVEVFLNEEDTEPMPGRKFININEFKGATAPITAIAQNNVYQVKLDGLAEFFKPNPEDPNNPITPTDPDPNAGTVTVYLKMKVTDWVINYITPVM